MNLTILTSYIHTIFAMPSPTGYTRRAQAYIQSEAEKLGYAVTQNEKGNICIQIPGKSKEKHVAVSAHIDTLGLMVRSITSTGTLRFVCLGGPILPTYDGEYCTIITRDQKQYTGTILSTAPSIHVYVDASDKKRDATNMEIRLDEVVKNKADVMALGIQNGDIIAIEPKTTICPSGYIKSRFIDDKLAVCMLLTLLHEFKDKQITPKYDSCFLITGYEEVGHGGAHIPATVTEMLAVDMGCIGDDLSCTEHDVSICAKDSSGPYDYDMVTRLIDLAVKYQLPHAVDIYPYYGSDVGAALKGGNDIKGALIGTGVHASHGMERTHMDGVNATMQLIMQYLCD